MGNIYVWLCRILILMLVSASSRADTFVINYLSAVPDVVIDFDQREGDLIELSFPEAQYPSFKTEALSVNRRGVVTWETPKGKNIPIVGLNGVVMKLKVDKRKGKAFLSFKIPVGGHS